MRIRKWFCLCLAFALLLSACRAAAPSDTVDADGRVRVLASFAPIYALTLAVSNGSTGITVDCMAANSTGCLHDYQLTTSDMKRVDAADVFIIGGAGMEASFLDKLCEQYPALRVFDSSANVHTLTEACGHAHDHDHDHEHAQDAVNAHLWLSCENAAQIAQNIAGKLSELDAENAALYSENAAQLCASLSALKAQYAPLFESAQHKQIITFHEAFAYLAAEFDLEVTAVIESEPGSAPDPQTLSELIDLAASGEVAAIFTEPQYPDATARVIAQETGVPVYALDPIVTGEMTADSFLSALQSDLQILLDAVQ